MQTQQIDVTFHCFTLLLLEPVTNIQVHMLVMVNNCKFITFAKKAIFFLYYGFGNIFLFSLTARLLWRASFEIK
jgi:hypothetical protein